MFPTFKSRFAALGALALMPFSAIYAQDTVMPSTLNDARNLTRQIGVSSSPAPAPAPASSPSPSLPSMGVIAARNDFARNAPSGFQYVRGEGLPYIILVPESAEFNGADPDGSRYVSNVGGLQVTVVLGKPITAKGDSPEMKLTNAGNTHFDCGAGAPAELNGIKARQFDLSSHCGKISQSTGQAIMVLRSDTIYPVVCSYSVQAEPSPMAVGYSYAEVGQKLKDLRIGTDTCDRIVHSVIFSTLGGSTSLNSSPGQKADVPDSLLQRVEPAGPVRTDSLAEAARKARAQKAATPARVFDDTN